MALIEFSPELVGLTKQVKRLADAVDALLFHAYGIHASHEFTRDDIIEKEDVMYSDSLTHARQELEDLERPGRHRPEDE